MSLLRCSFSAACLLAAIQSAAAAPLAIRDAGAVRRFETAADEIAVRGRDGTWRSERPGAATKAAHAAALEARARRAAPGEHVDVILYESGVPRTVYSRRVATGEVLAILKKATIPADIATAAGAVKTAAQPLIPGAFIFTFRGPGASLIGAETLRGIAGVVSADPILARQQKKRWIPNDTYFAYSSSNAGYQWHLRNTGQNGGTAGIDVNIVTAWDSWRGSGIRIGIMDDGLQVSHPDLSAHCDTANGYDWNSNDADPSPGFGDDHGTSCAGVAAGIGNNGAGISGAAPEATLVGMRLISTGSTDSTESAAILHRSDIIQVKSNSWGPNDDGVTIEGPGVQTAAALQNAATNGRGGLGTIITWAGGNGRADGDDSNFDGYANSIYTIAVGALADNGSQSWYSESGANLLVSAPSNGGTKSITTVDRTGADGYNISGSGNFPNLDYTNDFGGTSSACPLAAGCIAVLLQSKPSLGWRDVKEILLRSATKVSASDAGWFNNAAGFHWNDKFGAGLINTTAAVNLAANWSNLGLMLSQSVSASPGSAIPDNSAAGASALFAFNSAGALRVEQATVTVSIQHESRGELELYLTSPSGTQSKLARTRPDFDGSGLEWTFATPQFWGENSAGTWTLKAVDTATGSTGTLDSATVTLYGAQASPVPYITSAPTASGSTSIPFSFQVTATNSPTSWLAGGLPPGLAINASGLITGTPASAGTWTVSLTATNASGSGTGTLTITITTPVPVITSAGSASGVAGTPFSFQATATNSPTGWVAGGLPPGLLINSSGLISGTPASAGTWTVSLTASNLHGSDTKSLIITIANPPPSIAAAVDSPSLVFSQSLPPWFGQTATTHDGVDAAQSGDVDDLDSSWMETTMNGPGTVSFWARVSSETDYDFFRFYVDGSLITERSGTVAWVLISHSLPPGAHTLRWSYEKDDTVSSGSDAAWVDQVQFTGIRPLIAGGLSTGFQEPALNSTSYTWTPGFSELGWSATGGRVAEAGNRNPPLTGTVVSGTTGVKSFLINGVTSAVTLTTEPVDLGSFTSVRGEADVRTYATTNTTSFESTDNLRIFLQVSSDANTWTDGPDILPLRTGGTPDSLIALNTASVTAYNHFTSAALPAGTKYARIAVGGMANATSEFLIIDNLRLSGIASADADGDGYSAEIEAWFGTSDSSAGSAPVATLSRLAGAGRVTFPSVAGNSYAIDASSDLVNWTTFSVTAGGSTTIWTDPAGALVRRCYRVRKP